MNLSLTRVYVNPIYCSGVLAIQQPPWFTCDSIEPGQAGDHPAIPDGTYTVTLRPSARFKRNMPFLDDVPGREGIEIHPGNMPADTKGCILVGVKSRGPVLLSKSRETFDKLYEILEGSPMPIRLTVTTVPNPNKPNTERPGGGASA